MKNGAWYEKYPIIFNSDSTHMVDTIKRNRFQVRGGEGGGSSHTRGPRVTPEAKAGSPVTPSCNTDGVVPVFLIGWLAEGADGLPFAREAMCLVQCSISWCAVARSCSWQSSCLFQVNKPQNPVIEIPTVKWKEGGLLVARPSRGLPPRDQLSIGN